MTKKHVIEIISYSFILLFVYAAVSKLLDYDRFILQIGQSPILYPYARILGVGVPLIEIIISGMLAFHRSRLAGMYSAFTLMLIFTAYIVAILQFSKHIPCSCGGVLEMMGWNMHLVFNVVFTLLAIIGVLLSTNQPYRNSDTITSLQ